MRASRRLPSVAPRLNQTLMAVRLSMPSDLLIINVIVLVLRVRQRRSVFRPIRIQGIYLMVYLDLSSFSHRFYLCHRRPIHT